MYHVESVVWLWYESIKISIFPPVSVCFSLARLVRSFLVAGPIPEHAKRRDNVRPTKTWFGSRTLLAKCWRRCRPIGHSHIRSWPWRTPLSIRVPRRPRETRKWRTNVYCPFDFSYTSWRDILFRYTNIRRWTFTGGFFGKTKKKNPFVVNFTRPL